MDFRAHLEASVIKGIEQAKDRERSGKFAPSRLGRCYRYQIAQRRGEPESDPISPQLKMTFDIGTMTHRYIQKTLETDACEVKVETADIFGFCDYVGKDYVADFKTVGFFAWKMIEKANDATIIYDKRTDCLQLMTYAYLLEKPVGHLVYVKKDDMSIKQFTLYLAHWKKDVEDELTRLRQLWDESNDEGGLPKGSPRAYGGKECKYCVYQSSCPDYREPTAPKKTGAKKRKAAF